MVFGGLRFFWVFGGPMVFGGLSFLVNFSTSY